MAQEMTSSELKTLSAFVADTQYDDLPEEVVAHTKWLLRDSVGVLVAGMREPEVLSLASYASDNYPGKASLFGHGGKTKVEWAAFVHGTAATSLEMDEGHAYARGHASVHALPPALALAEALGTNGRETITAIVLGYEVAARAGIATQLREGVHPFGVWGVLGAAAVAAKFKGFNQEEIAGTLELASSYAISPSFETAYQGANVRNTFAGMVNKSGMLAADFYELGFRGEVGGLESAFGLILGSSFDATALSEDLGSRYEIMRGYFKPYSACRYAHAAVDALFGLEHFNDIEVSRIEAVQVTTYDIAAKLNKAYPKTPLAGRFSIPHVIAASLTLGSAGPEAFSEEALSDPNIQELGSRVEVIEDPKFTKMTPEKRPARIRVTYKDGDIFENTVFGSKGDPDQPMSELELKTKFENLMTPTVEKKNTELIWALLGRFEQLSDVSELADLLK